MDKNGRYSICWNIGFGKTKPIYIQKTKSTQQISEKPFTYKSTNFKDARLASLGNFSIFYKVTDKQVIIAAFWDNRQDPKKLLKLFQISN